MTNSHDRSFIERLIARSHRRENNANGYLTKFLMKLRLPWVFRETERSKIHRWVLYCNIFDVPVLLNWNFNFLSFSELKHMSKYLNRSEILETEYTSLKIKYKDLRLSETRHCVTTSDVCWLVRRTKQQLVRQFSTYFCKNHTPSIRYILTVN